MIFKDLQMELWQEIVIIIIASLIFLIILYILILFCIKSKKVTHNPEQSVIKETFCDNKTLNETKTQEAQTQKLSDREIRIRKRISENNITKKELLLLEKQEQIIIPEDLIINSITSNELKDNEFKNIEKGNTDFGLNAIKLYLQTKNNIKNTAGIGKRPDIYKINNRTICILKDLGNNKFNMSLKLGPAYASKMKETFKKNVIDSVFPQGLIWFSYNNQVTGNITLEAVKQAIDISYIIASLGY